MPRGRLKSPDSPPKRQRQKQLQAWLDPLDPQEGIVLDYANQVISSQYTPKQLIIDGVLALRATNNGDVPPLPATEKVLQLETQRYIGTLLGAIDRLSDMIEGISSLPQDTHQQVTQVVQQVNEAQTEFSAIEISIASRYQALEFEDD